jgi:protein-disulfide isomerase
MVSESFKKMRKETLVLGGIGLVTLLLVVGAAFFLSKPQDTSSQTKKIDPKVLIGKERHTVGSSSAKVTIVEFGDFQCPACGASNPIVNQILEEYKDQVYFVFRHFPLPMHKNARLAAAAAGAAGKQGNFFEMGDKLFDTQAVWGETNNAKETFLGFAKELGLDTAVFEQDLDNADLKQAVQDDQNAGIKLGVNSTPSFFINGTLYPGVLTYDTFKDLIDKELQ